MISVENDRDAVDRSYATDEVSSGDGAGNGSFLVGVGGALELGG